MTGRELEERIDLIGRLIAIIAELDRLPADVDVDVPRTLAEGALEELERELSREHAGTPSEVWVL